LAVVAGMKNPNDHSESTNVKHLKNINTANKTVCQSYNIILYIAYVML